MYDNWCPQAFFQFLLILWNISFWTRQEQPMDIIDLRKRVNMLFPGDVDYILIVRVELVILIAEFLTKLLGELYFAKLLQIH